jgi:hypothetical protein
VLIIQGDVACDNWKALLINCLDSFNHVPKIAQWAPIVDYTYFNLEKTKIADLKNTTLTIVSLSDLIVFAVKHDVVSRMKKLDYESNVLGWGIGWIIAAYIYVNNRIAVVDNRVKVSHPKGSGYDGKEAKLQMQKFLKQMSMEEIIQYQLLKSYTYK